MAFKKFAVSVVILMVLVNILTDILFPKMIDTKSWTGLLYATVFVSAGYVAAVIGYEVGWVRTWSSYKKSRLAEQQDKTITPA